MNNSSLLNKKLPPESGAYDNKHIFGGSVAFGENNSDTAISAISFVATAGASNIAEVAISVKDASGTLITGVQNLKLWLSDAATGAELTGTTASGTVTAKSASGYVLDAFTAKKSLIVQTLATGVFTLEITDTAKTGFYVCVQNPFTGKTVVSSQLVTANYGA